MQVFEKIIDQLKAESIIVDNAAGNRAVEIIEQAAAEYNNGWIPYDEPPKSNDYVLLQFVNFPVPQIGRYEEDGAYYIGDEDETCAQQYLVVDAWQPLPEPYQTKGE